MVQPAPVLISELRRPTDRFACPGFAEIIDVGTCQTRLNLSRTGTRPKPCKTCGDGALIEEMLCELAEAERHRKPRRLSVVEAPALVAS